jgi:hypothetical protein
MHGTIKTFKSTSFNILCTPSIRDVEVALKVCGGGGGGGGKGGGGGGGGSGACPRKILKLKSLKCYFLHFRKEIYRVIKVTKCHKISQIIFVVYY